MLLSPMRVWSLPLAKMNDPFRYSFTSMYVAAALPRMLPSYMYITPYMRCRHNKTRQETHGAHFHPIGREENTYHTHTHVCY